MRQAAAVRGGDGGGDDDNKDNSGSDSEPGAAEGGVQMPGSRVSEKS